MKRHEVYYDCCPEPYIDVTVYLKGRRRYRVDPETGEYTWRPENNGVSNATATIFGTLQNFPWFVNS